MSERWRRIADFPMYEVSDKGSVRRRACKDANFNRYREARLLRATPGSRGYLQVWLSYGKKTSRAVHRLVLEAFKGPCPPSKIGCHNDGDKTNNALGNLRWDTHAANDQDSIRHGVKPRGEQNGNSRLTEIEVRHIRTLFTSGKSMRALARETGYSRPTIRSICFYKSWRHVQ